MSRSLSRRELLRAGAASAALGASTLAAESLTGRALGATAAKTKPGARLSDVEHIIVLMQENRSFDSYFGLYPGVRGFADKKNAKSFKQKGYNGPGNVDGRLLPFHLEGKKPVGQCLPDPTHDWEPQHQSWNNGKNDRFYEIHARDQWDGPAAPDIMGFYGQQDIPYHWALAKAYTLCDMYFCSVIGPTSPNRCFSVSASIGQDGRKGGPCIETVFDANGIKGDFQWTTMPEQLQARKITWKSYTEAVGQFDNVFPAFRQFRNNSRLNALGIKPTYPNDFTADLKKDALPAVSWVQLSFLESEHAANPPGKGEAGIDRFLRLLWKYPKVWKKTAVIVNYDENGGFFDHVPPPVAPQGTKGEYLSMKTLPPEAGGIRGPIGLGFRVPCIIVSPWTRGRLRVLGRVRPHVGAQAHREALRRGGAEHLLVAPQDGRRPDVRVQLRGEARLLHPEAALHRRRGARRHHRGVRARDRQSAALPGAVEHHVPEAEERRDEAAERDRQVGRQARTAGWPIVPDHWSGTPNASTRSSACGRISAHSWFTARSTDFERGDESRPCSW